MFRIRILILLLSLTISGLQAQNRCNFVLKGKVISAENAEPIPFASLELTDADTKRTAITNQDGTFEIKEICQNEILLTVRFVGFKRFEKVVRLRTGDNNIDVTLEVDVTNLDAVTIEEEKVAEIVSLQRAEVDELTLSRSAGTSLGEALTDITGVNMLQTGPTIAKPVIHGLHSNRILILNNGIRQEGQQWGQEHAPEIDPFVANNLKLIKGAAAVKYGSDAIGGVILVNPSELPNTASFSGKINMVGALNNAMGAGSALLEGGIEGLEGFGWRVQGTYKIAGDSRAADYRLTNTGTREQNFSLGLGYHKHNKGAEVFFSSFDAELGVLRSAHIGNLTDLARAIDGDRPLFIEDFSYDINSPYQSVKHQLLKVNGHIELPKLGSFSVQYGLQNNKREEFDVRRAGRSSIPALSLDLVTHTLDFDLDMGVRGNWKWDVGASFMYQNNENNPETGIRPLIPDFENWTAGAHLISRYIRPSFELELGARYDFKHYLVKRFDRQNNLLKPEFDFNNLTGSIGAIFFLENDWTLRTNLGSAWRAPHVNELYSEGLHHGAAAIEEGNELLKSEKAIKWITSFEKRTERFSLNLAAYYNLISDYIYLRPESVELTIRGAFPVFGYQQTDALFYGLDGDIDYRLTDRLNLNGRLSLIRAKDRNTDSPLVNIPTNQLEASINYNFNAGRLSKPFVSLGLRAVDRQRNAPRVVTITEVLEANRTDIDLFAQDPSIFDFVAPPDAYVNFNLSGGFDLEFSKERILNVFLSIDNLLNNSYRDYLNRFRYYADDLGRNVSLRVSYSF